MQKKNIVKLTACFLALTMAVVSFGGCAKNVKTDNAILNQELNGEAYQQTEYAVTADNENVKKEESVYVNTKSDGTAYQIHVTDWMHTTAPQVRIEDESDLDDILNIHTLTEPVRTEGKLIWDMDTTDLYYSGTSNKDLPLSFDIQYFLNEEPISAEDLAGKAGDVAIQITLHNAQKQTVQMDGKSYEVTAPILVVGGTIFPEDVFTNIAIDNGTAVSDGAKQLVFFAGIPGMDESLGVSEL